MTGQNLVDLVTTFTGRNESAKHLTRLNAIYRKLYSDYEFTFNVAKSAIAVLPRVQNLSFGFTSGTSVLTGETATQALITGIGGWIDVPSTLERYYVYSSTGSAWLINPAATFSGTVACSWLKTDYSLSQPGTGNASTGIDFGRIKRVWCDAVGSDLENISEPEYRRRFGYVDINSIGAPQVFCQIVADRNGATNTREPGIRIWPIPDVAYTLHYDYQRVPDALTLTNYPELGDGRFDDTLAWGAAWLARLDDVDTTRMEFKKEYDDRVASLLWSYGISPKSSEKTLGPRDPVRPRSSGQWW